VVFNQQGMLLTRKVNRDHKQVMREDQHDSISSGSTQALRRHGAEWQDLQWTDLEE